MKKSTMMQSKLFEGLPDILNVNQVRTALGIGRAGVYKLLDSREINTFKIGNAYRIPKSALIEYINRNCVKGGVYK